MTKAETINLVSLLTTALGKMTEDEKENANDLNTLVKKGGQFDITKSGLNWSAGGYVQNVINLLNADLIAEENKAQAKANGDTIRLRAALAWQKRQKKNNTNNYRKILNYPDYQDSMQVYTDGYMIVALKNRLGFEEKPENLTEEYSIKFKKVIPSTYGEELEMPDLAKLKVWYKNAKKIKSNQRQIGGKSWIIYNFGDWKAPTVNAEYLITAMEIMTPDTKWYISNPTTGFDKDGRERGLAHIYGENSIGENCYMMGIWMLKENDKGKTEL